MLTIYSFTLDNIKDDIHQALIDDDTILKLRFTERDGFRNGMTTPDIMGIFDTNLADQKNNPMAVEDIRSVQIRDDHPTFSWILLHVGFTDTRGQAQQ